MPMATRGEEAAKRVEMSRRINQLSHHPEPPPTERLPRANILGVGVSAINPDIAVETVHHWIANGEKHYVCVTGVHGVTESSRDERLRQIHNEAGLVAPDGMPLVWVSRMMGFRQVDRVYGPDLMLAVCSKSAARGYRHFFYGGARGIPEKLAERLRDRFPGIQIVGTYSPPFRRLTQEEDEALVETINKSHADLVWVGLSTPKQEYWMAEHRTCLDAAALVGVGAAFDFHSGAKRQAPRWIQRSGLEWLFRLCAEPRRLASRYLRNNPLFLCMVAMQLLGRRPAPLEISLLTEAN